MTKQELLKYQTALEAKLKELVRIKRRVAEIQISSQSEPEDVAAATSVHLAISSADLDSVLRKAIVTALERIKSGDYGVCLGCEKEIGKKRLDAVPWTPLCIACQNKAEQGDPKLVIMIRMP